MVRKKLTDKEIEERKEQQKLRVSVSRDARRKNVVTMTIPFEDKILFVAAKPDVDIDKTARKILDLL
jgi:hypothetical protein